MKINAGGIWLSDGTKLEQATQRTLRLALTSRAGSRRTAIANRVVQALGEIRDKRWNAIEKACWLDNAIADGEIDGGVVLLIVAGYVDAGRKVATQARVKYTAEQRDDVKKRARSLPRGTAKRQVARDLEVETGIPAETIRSWLKK